MTRLVMSLVLFAGFAGGAQAQDYRAGPIEIQHPWTRATPKGAAVAGGYLKVTNTGTTPDRLIGGSADVAQKFEIHEMSMDGGVMRMRELKDGVAIPPGASVELKPGSYHIMMMKLAHPLVAGERVKGSLTFEKAGKVDMEFVVEAMGANPKERMH